MRPQDLIITAVGIVLVGTVVHVLVTPEELAESPGEASGMAEQSQAEATDAGHAENTTR